MKTLFVATGPIEWASCRMRAYWPAQHMSGAEVVEAREAMAENFTTDADAVIFQKIVPIERAREYKAAGKRLFWDLCDPIYWWNPEGSREILQYMDGVVTSNSDLTTDFVDWSDGKVPAYTIPDRLDLAHFPLRREHQESKPIRFVWYGIMNNRIAIFGALATLERIVANGYSVSLSICDDRPDLEWQVTGTVPMYYIRWSLEQENQIIASHDIALLPEYPGPWGKVKSNNKTLTAWACGLPVTTGFNYEKTRALVELVEARKQQAESGRMLLEREYQVEQSAWEWEAILCG